MWTPLPLTALKTRLQVCSRRDLLDAGHSARGIDRLVNLGQLQRFGPHWFGTAITPGEVARALRRNHRLTCASALNVHGVFVPESPWPHEVGRQCSCRTPAGVIEHRPLRRWPDDEPVLPLRASLRHAVSCLGAEGAAIVLESALNKGFITVGESTELTAHLSLKQLRAIGRVDGRSMSGPETRVRRFLERQGVEVQPQFHVASVGFVDMLVGDRLVIECDSIAHHTGSSNYAADRRRDQALAALGFQVIRLTYQDVMQNWDQTRELLRHLIRRGIHRRPRRRGPGVTKK